MEQLAISPDSVEVDLPSDGAAKYVDTSVDTSVDSSDDLPESEGLEPGLEEIELDGKRYVIPQELKDKFLMQQDYTKKTQTLAEQRRSDEADRETIKADREAVTAERQLNQSALRLAAQREHLTSTYQQLEQIDLQALNQSDPVEAQGVLIKKQQIANAIQNVHGQLQQHEQKIAESEQQNYAKSAEKASSYLSKEIKGWQPNNDVDKGITEYAAALGLKGPQLSKAIIQSPQIGVLLHKARQFDDMVQKQVAAAAKSKPEPQEKPITRITASKGTAVKDPSQMTDREFSHWRQSSIQKRYK